MRQRDIGGKQLPALIGYLEGGIGKTIKATKFVKQKAVSKWEGFSYALDKHLLAYFTSMR